MASIEHFMKNMKLGGIYFPSPPSKTGDSSFSFVGGAKPLIIL